jgi:hypothetical protein
MPWSFVQNVIRHARNGLWDQPQSQMLAAVSRLLGPVGAGPIRLFDPREINSFAGLGPVARDLLLVAYLRWLCGGPGPDPDRALPLQIDKIEKALARSSADMPAEEPGEGLEPALPTPQAFLAALEQLRPQGPGRSRRRVRSE